MSGLLSCYDDLIAAGELKPDPDQRAAAIRLDRLQQELEAAPKKGSVLWRMLRKAPEPIRGVYLWGGVGRGKSMLMDLMRDCLDGPAKRRIHFHEFMLDVHARLRAVRESESGDPIAPVAAQLAAEAKVLLFDEMVVNNMADAAIMSRLFTALFDAGVTLVATSNRAPDDLYKDGLNRELFLPFIDLLKARLDVVPLNGPTDYRLDRLGGMDIWHVPNGDETTAKLREIFFRLTDYPPEDSANVPSEELSVGGGRSLHVPKSLKGVAVFSFKRLCGEARGAADYLAIARRFHSVIIVGIPVLGPENRNEAARFVTLIDALYEHKVKLIGGADALPQHLYPQGDGKFEFERTVSRLMEMQSLEYLALGHGAHAS
ncbi:MULTISPECIES: cell division protein ZapE [Sphingobium]|uniref:cell division protein ZapE n=1 Tax=Sphingobium TaxID=165695 RepID=UPI0015EBDB51|nr:MULTISPECIES: cell division protein ZapE [Sphingobium]MCW2363618.1 cell division protein ZapE [Sphingobium sp. B10D3B]MCW2364840.1 cell division protein ZapE [Sphingobium sp. B7D2B]MCW2383442.1 cell division protein ZapE [Sphingobium sp. B2D3B]MCW2399583.1 cell division protein ZapE [Sphingobium sp. B2D3C]MCW2402984.1 cell division protein ZapE [Sphingobium sp. B10D7B]